MLNNFIKYFLLLIGICIEVWIFDICYFFYFYVIVNVGGDKMLIDFNYRVFGLFYFNLFDWKCEKINNIGYNF